MINAKNMIKLLDNDEQTMNQNDIKELFIQTEVDRISEYICTELFVEICQNHINNEVVECMILNPLNIQANTTDSTINKKIIEKFKSEGYTIEEINTEGVIYGYTLSFGLKCKYENGLFKEFLDYIYSRLFYYLYKYVYCNMSMAKFLMAKRFIKELDDIISVNDYYNILFKDIEKLYSESDKTINKYKYFYDYIKENNLMNYGKKIHNVDPKTISNQVFNCDVNQIKEKGEIVKINTVASDRIDNYVNLFKESIKMSNYIATVIDIISCRAYFDLKIKSCFFPLNDKNVDKEIKKSQDKINDKYDGLPLEISSHIYIGNNQDHYLKFINFERSPEVSKKSLYDRIRINFSILGIEDKKNFLEVNKKVILEFILNKISKYAYFKKVPLNYFEISFIEINKFGDVTMVMELNKKLYSLETPVN